MAQVQPIRVRLWDHVGTGIIIRWPSGIVFEQQIGGKSCGLAELQGVFVPVANDLSLDGKLLSAEARLRKYFEGPPHLAQGAVDGLNENDAIYIESALHENLLLRNVVVDRTRLRDTHESWVWVCIHTPDVRALPLFEGMSPFPLTGILTWTNNS
jgi:hypothetical protein